MSEAVRPVYRHAVWDSRRWDGFVSRPGDIFICTPSKCGTTWMQTIVASLLWPAGDVPGSVFDVSVWLEANFQPLDLTLARLDGQTHRRFLKTHTPANCIPLFESGRYIVVGRDGRDAFMSWCNHRAGMRPEVVRMLNEAALAEGVRPLEPWGGDVHAAFVDWLDRADVFEHIASFWPLRARENVLFVHYNDLKADLDGEMRRVASFLDIEVPEPAWPQVVDRCTFANMRARGAEIGPFELLFEGGSDTFLHKGTNGRWRDVLTPAELAAYDARAAELMTPDARAWLDDH
jgi:aryl sulfotransferase